MTGPRNLRTIINGNFIRIEEPGGKRCEYPFNRWPAWEGGGWGTDGLPPRLGEEKKIGEDPQNNSPAISFQSLWKMKKQG